MQHVESKAEPELHRRHHKAIRREGCPHQPSGQQHAAQGQQALFAKARHQAFRKPRIGEGAKPKARHHQSRHGRRIAETFDQQRPRQRKRATK